MKRAEPLTFETPWPVIEHELRGTAATMSGLVRLLVEDRLSEADRTRVLASLRNAAGRAAKLASDAGAIYRWTSTPADAAREAARLDDVVRAAAVRSDVRVSGPEGDPSVRVDVIDGNALADAFAALVRTAARESAQAVEWRIRTTGTQADVCLGPAQTTFPAPAEREPFDAHRSGMGLSLLLARVVIEAHDGEVWQASNSVAFGATLPLTDAR